jgi:ABC-type glycerol-3-phosphate transport system substrate-binding protein
MNLTSDRFALKHRRLSVVCLTMVLAIGLTGCGLPGQPDAAATPSPMITDAPAPAAVPTTELTPEDGVTTLTWWTPEFLSPDPAQPGGAVLDQMLSNFTAAQEGRMRVKTEVKGRYGKGGLMDYLRAAQPVAPGILPDIVALDAAELEQAAALGLLRPLDSVLDADTQARLFSGGRVLGQINGQTLAVPVVLDVEHVMHDRRQVATPPVTWSGLLAGNTQYLFPLASPLAPSHAAPGEGAQPAALSHYYGAQDSPDPAARRLELSEEPLLRLLHFYDDAQAQGQLAPRPAELASLEAVRQAYTPGTPALLEISARQFLAEEEALAEWAAAAIPGWASPSPSLLNGWVLAIVTPDPERQRLAAELIAWLLAPERNGP